jgi:hypothetical protein
LDSQISDESDESMALFLQLSEGRKIKNGKWYNHQLSAHIQPFSSCSICSLVGATGKREVRCPDKGHNLSPPMLKSQDDFMISSGKSFHKSYVLEPSRLSLQP